MNSEAKRRTAEMKHTHLGQAIAHLRQVMFLTAGGDDFALYRQARSALDLLHGEAAEEDPRRRPLSDALFLEG